MQQQHVLRSCVHVRQSIKENNNKILYSSSRNAISSSTTCIHRSIFYCIHNNIRTINFASRRVLHEKIGIMFQTKIIVYMRTRMPLLFSLSWTFLMKTKKRIIIIMKRFFTIAGQKKPLFPVSCIYDTMRPPHTRNYLLSCTKDRL